MTVQASLVCPDCGSSKVVKDGIRYFNDGSQAQRWLCRGCFYRFVPESSKRRVTNNGLRECAERKDPKNSLSLVSYTIENLEWTSRENLQEAKGKITEFAWKMKKRGLAESTITNRIQALNFLARKGANLSDPESIETVLATEKWSPATKANIVRIYQAFCKTFNISWTPPKIHYEPKQPFIPLESEIDQLIAGCGKRTATFLQALKDTGARCGEAIKLKWTDVNSENNTIAINNPEKGSRSRTIKVSIKTIAMISAMPKKYGDYIFNPNQAPRDAFYLSREKIARKLQNPRLRQIHFHTLRHFKGSTEAMKTRDPFHVKYLLGHKKLENTEIYMHLTEFGNEEYHSSTAKTVEEALKLIDSGFEYVTDMDDLKLFRRRK